MTKGNVRQTWWYAAVAVIYLTDFLLPPGRGGWPWNVIFNWAPTLLLIGWFTYVIGRVTWNAVDTLIRRPGRNQES